MGTCCYGGTKGIGRQCVIFYLNKTPLINVDIDGGV
jgi:hypothetical protein